MNNQNNRNSGNNGRRPLIFYYILAFVVIMLLNAYVFPTMFKPQVENIPYSTFLQMVDEGKFSKVEIATNGWPPPPPTRTTKRSTSRAVPKTRSS